MDNQSNKKDPELGSAELKKVWSKTHLSEQEFNPDTDRAWENLMRKAQENRSKSIGYWKIAATVSLLVMCSWMIWNYSQIHRPKIKLVSAEDTVKSVTLADGSQVWINALSSISYADDFLQNREIVLKGEAFFEVSKMNGQPFTVLTETSKITVLGTSFNVREEKTGNVKVQVATGKVAVEQRKKPDHQILLIPGEEAEIETKIVNQPISKKTIEDQNFRSWQNQVLTFSNDPLTEIAQKLSEHYRKEIKIDQSLSKCRYTTSFDHQSLDEVLEILRLTGDLEITYTSNQIKISGTPCK